MATYNSSVVTKKYTISLPFSFTSIGGVDRPEEGSTKYWQDRILSLLMTGDYERIGYMYYGAALQNYLFTNPELVMVAISDSIEQMFGRWLPQLTFDSVKASYDDVTAGMYLSIYYKLPSGEDSSVKINTADLTAAGEVVKVN